MDGLSKASLIDEYQLWLHPVILARGKPLFNPDNYWEQERRCLKMIDTESFTSGVVMIQYQAK